MGRFVLQNTLYGFSVQFNVIAFFPFEDAFFFHLIEFGRQGRTCHVNVFGQLRKGMCQFHGRSALGDLMCSIKTSLPLASMMFTSKVPSSNTYRLQHISPCSRITVFSLIS